MDKEIKPSTIKNFLERFRKLAPPHKKIKEFLMEVLLSRYNIVLDVEQVRIVQNHIYIRTTPIRKTEILKKKSEIIQILEKEFNLVNLDIS
ncbi:MAG: hypothetical protein KBC22_00450 [Candidatus Pacebacteria bacterium]|nr:hypothetical protein [Candidatus Paceibacterota bacterium]